MNTQKYLPFFVDATVKLSGKKNLQSESDGVGFGVEFWALDVSDFDK
jgi:hypothetical protein